MSSKWSKEGKKEDKCQIRNQIEHEFYYWVNKVSNSKKGFKRPKHCVIAPAANRSGQGEVITNLIENTKVTVQDRINVWDKKKSFCCFKVTTYKKVKEISVKG